MMLRRVREIQSLADHFEEVPERAKLSLTELPSCRELDQRR